LEPTDGRGGADRRRNETGIAPDHARQRRHGRFSARHRAIDIPISGGDEVADVTGAGDTVIATFTAALAAGADTEEAAHLANYAGGIVVMKRGTATVSQQELLQALDHAAPVTRPH